MQQKEGGGRQVSGSYLNTCYVSPTWISWHTELLWGNHTPETALFSSRRSGVLERDLKTSKKGDKSQVELQLQPPRHYWSDTATTWRHNACGYNCQRRGGAQRWRSKHCSRRPRRGEDGDCVCMFDSKFPWVFTFRQGIAHIQHRHQVVYITVDALSHTGVLGTNTHT